MADYIIKNLDFSGDVNVDNITIQKRILGKKGNDVSAADYMTLGDGNYFSIKGGAILKAIHKDGWTSGSVIHLKFDAPCDMNHLNAFDPNYYSFFFTSEGNINVDEASTVSFIFDEDNAQWRCLDPSL